jgi:CBS domain-containing protein
MTGAEEKIMSQARARARISDLMIRTAEVAHLHATLRVTAQRMRASGLRALPVVDGDELVGVISGGDITRHRRKDRMDLGTVEIRDVMRPGVPLCFEHQRADDVAAMMAELKVRHLPVLDAEKKLTGMVARSDLPKPRRSANVRFSRTPAGDETDDLERANPGLKVYSDRPKLKD